MSMEIQRHVGGDLQFDPSWMERIILKLSDEFAIRITWNRDTAVLTGVCAVAGGIIGNYAGGRLGAALGAGIGSATGFGVSKMVSLRDVWETIKDKLQELVYIVFNFLRRLDPVDYVHAVKVLLSCSSNRRELVLTMLDFIASKLGREVISSITAG